jgi:hypothetical protein
VERGLLEPDENIDLEKAFLLVRDIPYYIQVFNTACKYRSASIIGMLLQN